MREICVADDDVFPEVVVRRVPIARDRVVAGSRIATPSPARNRYLPWSLVGAVGRSRHAVDMGADGNRSGGAVDRRRRIFLRRQLQGEIRLTFDQREVTNT